MEALVAALSFEGLWLLIGAVVVGGIVRGFSGFGTAMVFIPIAATVAEPVHTIIMMLIFDMFGPLPLVPRALRDGEPRDVGLLSLGSLVGLIIGVSILVRLDPEVFRWAVCLIALLMLTLLASGWRYKSPLRPWATVLVGWVGGLAGGISALAGPPVILSYMSSPRKPAAIRANILLYLLVFDLMMFVVFAINGLLLLVPVLIGCMLAVPYSIAGIIGTWVFDPANERMYRWVAYALIAAAAILGLPVWAR